MLVRTTRVLCATALAVSSLVGLGATDAFAVGGCTARASLPARVYVDRLHVVFSAPVITDCVNYLASAYLTKTSGDLDFLVYDDQNPTESIGFESYNTPGTYSTVGTGDYFADNGPLTWISTSTTIKNTTWSYVASSRQGAAVYVNTLVKQYSGPDSGIVRGAGRVSYLQRYINGAWQNMLARTANSTGQWTVGFVQPKVYQYRIVTTESTTAWNGSSGSTFR